MRGRDLYWFPAVSVRFELELSYNYFVSDKHVSWHKGASGQKSHLGCQKVSMVTFTLHMP